MGGMFGAQFPMLAGDVILTCQNDWCAHRWLWSDDFVTRLYSEGREALCPNCGGADLFPPPPAVPFGEHGTDAKAA
jgi:hypothetical protein